jgi:hypothetical protein
MKTFPSSVLDIAAPMYLEFLQIICVKWPKTSPNPFQVTKQLINTKMNVLLKSYFNTLLESDVHARVDLENVRAWTSQIMYICEKKKKKRENLEANAV